jgi:hypothetical protein
MKGLNDGQIIFQEWRRLITQYSTVNVSVEQDKLPAIGGLAANFCRNSPKSLYLAGLWSDTLIDDFLWYRTGNYKSNFENKSTLHDLIVLQAGLGQQRQMGP